MIKKVFTVMILVFLLIYSTWASEPETVYSSETTPSPETAPPPETTLAPETATLMSPAPAGNITAPPKTTPPPEQETATLMSPAPAGNITAPPKTTPPPVWTIDKECYEEALKEPDTTVEEAEKLCTVVEAAMTATDATPVTPSPPPVEIDVKDLCTSLENKLFVLTEKISIASPEERKSLLQDIETVRMELMKCEEFGTAIEAVEAVIVSTPLPRKPCEEVEQLKEELENFGHKVEEVKILVDKGEITGEEALEYEEELESMQEKLKRAEEACQHSIEAVSSLEDVERIYLTKLEASIEGAEDKEELMEELAKIEEEKWRLIEDFTEKIQELEFKKVKIIKKLRIEGSEVYLDDVKVTVPRVKIEVEGVEVELVPKGEEMEIIEGEVTVRGKVKLEYSDDVLTAVESGRLIKVLPSELKEIVKDEVEEVEVVDEEVPKYIVKSREKGKLLGVMPVTVAKESQVNAEDGKVISDDKPWWSFLVFQ